MKILEELREAKGFDTFTCLTYNASLPWFEALIHRQLRYRGVRRFLIFADRNQLSSSLVSAARDAKLLGRGYIVHGVPGDVRFHPKLYLLTGEAGARLYVGSGNLSRGGLDRNLEVFERWDSADGRGGWPAPFAVAREVLERLLARLGDRAELERNHLEQAFRGFERATPCRKRLLASPPALLEQLPRPDGPCEHLRLVAPFFDPEGEMIEALADRLRARRVTVLTHLAMTTLTRRAVERVRGLGGEVERVTDKRAVHGKLVHARGEGWALGVVGSANISHTAWRGANYELIVAFEQPEAEAVGALIDALETAPLTDDDLARLDAMERDRDAEKESGGEEEDDATGEGAPVIARAIWLSGSRVGVRLVEGATASALELGGRLGATRVSVEPDLAEYEIPASSRRGEPCLVRAWSNGGAGPWAVVHDLDDLIERSAPPSTTRRALELFLGEDGFNYDAASALLEVIAEVMADRSKRAAQARTDAGGERGRDRGASSTVFIGAGDFDEPEPESEQARKPASRAAFSLLSARTMNRLLFGDEGHDGAFAGEGEGESELDDDGELDDEAEFDGDDDDDAVSEASASRSGRVDRDAIARRRQQREAFERVCERVRVNYLRQLGLRRPRHPQRLLEELMVLAAPLHYLVATDKLNARGLRCELVLLLRGFLGARTSPFAAAVERLPPDEREAFWAETPALLVIMLLVYNACLADLVDSTLVRADPTFPDARPILWLRHAVRSVGEQRLDQFVEYSRTCGRAVRAGRIFWLADTWRSEAAAVPFAEFVDRIVADMRALARICAEILEGGYATRLRRDGEEEDGLIAVDEHGVVGVGWGEHPESPRGAPTPPLVARVRAGAFEEAQAYADYQAPMAKFRDRYVVFSSQLWDAADRGEAIDLDGLDVLDRLADL